MTKLEEVYGQLNEERKRVTLLLSQKSALEFELDLCRQAFAAIQDVKSLSGAKEISKRILKYKTAPYVFREES